MQRLRVVHSLPDESLADVLARGRGAWTLRETAAANGLPLAGALEPGTPVKLPRFERYVSAGARAEEAR